MRGIQIKLSVLVSPLLQASLNAKDDVRQCNAGRLVALLLYTRMDQASVVREKGLFFM